MRLASPNIRSKLAGLAFALVGSVVVALTMHFSAGQAEATEKSLQGKAQTYAQLLAREAEAAIAFDDVETTREIFEAASLDPDVVAATLYKSNGTVLGAIGQHTVDVVTLNEPVVRRSPEVIAVIAPVISKEGPRGVLVIEFSRAQIVKEQARAKRGAALAGLIAAALGLGASWLIGGSFSRRVRRIQRATQAVAGGNLDGPAIVDSSNDEIGQLSGAFNVMARHIREEAIRLDRTVVERTLELRRKNDDLAFILDNVGQGFATVDRTGRLAVERSAILARWFGVQSLDTSLWDYIATQDVEAAQWLAVGWDALFDGYLPPELVMDQLPKEVRLGSLTFGLRYQPILSGDGDSIQAVIVIVSDVSDEIARRKAEANQRELAGIFARFVAEASAVEQFVTEGAVLVRLIGNGAADAASLVDQQRWIHTLKGNSAFLGLERIATTCHEMETQIAETGDPPSGKFIATLDQLWSELMQIIGPLTSGRRERTLVRTATLRRHIKAIRDRVPRCQLASEVETWLLEPTVTRLERAGAQAVTVARRLEKPEPTIKIEDNDLTLDATTWGPFWTALIHVVRNAVDHGIEDPGTRLAADKPAAGSIALRTFQRDTETVVEIEDDGAGIDWESLRRNAGLSAIASPEELVEALFRSGVSTKTEVSETSGRGIGLGAARAACEEMGGHVDVRSRRGRGSVFSFCFPFEVGEQAAPSGRFIAA